MELPRIVHDEFLHKVEEPQEQHLEQVLHAAEVELPTKYDGHGKQRYLSEHSPLLKPTLRGNHIVVIDPEKVEAILTAEEEEAIEADRKMNAWDIVGEESLILVKLAIPMVCT